MSEFQWLVVLSAGFAIGLALVWVGAALELNYRRSRRVPASVRAYVDPPEEEQAGG